MVSNSDKGLYTCRPEGMVGEDKVALHVLQPPVVEERMPSNLAKSDSAVTNKKIVFLASAWLSSFLR